MNLSPINYQPNVKIRNFNQQPKNVNFRAKNGEALVRMLEANKGSLAPEQLQAFLKQNFGRFNGKGVKDVLENLLPYIAGITTASAGLLAAKNSLEAENETLKNEKNYLLKNEKKLQDNVSELEEEFTRILESKDIKNIELNKNGMTFDYNGIKYRIDIKPNVIISKQKILLDVMDGKRVPDGVKIVKVKTSTLPSVDTLKIIDYFESYCPTVSDVIKEGPIRGSREYSIDKNDASHDSHAGQYHCFLTYEYNGEQKQINDYFYGKDNKNSLKQRVTDMIQNQINNDVKSLEATTENDFANLIQHG